MTYQGVKKSNNAIVCGGRSPIVLTHTIETVTNMYPGRVVQKGTNDNDIVVHTDSDNMPYGWLGYEQCTAEDQPSTVDTIYTGITDAPVLVGGGFFVVASAASGEYITKGEFVCGKDAGEVGSATIGTDELIGVAEETVNAAGASADIIVRSLI